MGRRWILLLIYIAMALLILTVGVIVTLSVMSDAPLAAPIRKDQSMLLQDHPLAETLWNTASGARATPKELESALIKADYILLGEKHDNARHHALQAEMIDRVGALAGQGSVVFEMAEPHHQPLLTNAKSEALTTLGSALEWEKRGWPEWPLYEPVFASALSHGMALLAGNPERQDLMTVGQGGSLPESLLQDLWWDHQYNKDQTESLTDELVDAHCGMLPRQAVGPMMQMQRLKDAHMGRTMRHAHAEGGVSILIAGNGHTRKDRGAPMFLEPEARIVSVGFMEVVRGQVSPSDYEVFNTRLYDWIWFTPRVDEIDPCEKFKEQLKSMKTRKSQMSNQ